MSQPDNNLTEPAPSETLLQMISGFWVSQIVYVAAKLGLADYIATGAKTAEELAAITGTHAPSLYRLLRALASIGIFTEKGDRRFAITPLATTLQDKPGSLRAFAIAVLGDEHTLGWRNLLHSVRTGETGFDRAAGTNIWDYYDRHPEDSQIFNEAMTSLSGQVIDAVLANYDFSPFKQIADVAGGHGSLLTAILKANPSAKGILFDLPPVIESARAHLEAGDVGDRVTPITGSFFESIPAGADAYILKWIIHDWDDLRARKILKNCREAMTENAKLLIIEQVIPPGNDSFFGKLVDINMLVMAGGCERTEREFQDLLRSEGFHLTRVVHTPSPVGIIEAFKV